jgi:WD40 repeat protein
MLRPLYLVLVASLMLAASTQSTMAQGGEPSREPILRIESGMHTAAIRHISVDRAGKFLVTASQDKTARVWEVASGRLLRVLRVPIGDGNEGTLSAAAIAPDGNTIAAGGYTRKEGQEGNIDSIYLFERESGRLLRRLTGLPSVVPHLAFSPDGTLLAATLGRTNGVRVWRTSDWAEVGRDTDYGDSSYGADFDRAGRLVTSCFDGQLRLYDHQMRLLVKQAATGGKLPFAVRFSPDGRKVAVGYDDSTRLDVLNADTLALLYSADTSSIISGNFYGVAWSTDGTMLYAGGAMSDKFRSRPIFRWSDAGRGRYVDTPAASNTIMDIAALPTGGIVYGAFDPLWGILDSQHRRTPISQAGLTADYRSLLDNFLTDAHASAIRFGYELGGASPAVFQLSDRTLKPDAPAISDMRPPLTEAPGLSVTDWKNTGTPRLNNRPLKLEQYEFSRSVAIAPDGERFLLGTEFFIRLFNRSGQELWKAPIPGVAWAVNISGDGRLVLAAYGDGTIRWYRMTDGKELLAFFPHKDRKRWILWTPSGYYDASPGAEELIGWHVNRGRDAAADFFPVGQFRNIYYRPDVVAKILQTGDEQLALKEVNEESGRKGQQASVAQLLPPVVEIVSPVDGAEVAANEVKVRFRLRTPSGEPVTEVRALVDGRPAGGERGLSLKPAGTGASDERELRVTVPEGESQVSVIASNRFTTSVPATLRVRTRKAVASSTTGTAGDAATSSTAGAAFEIKPKLYVLAVGVSNYADPNLKLGFASKDARDFAAALERQKGMLYRDVVVRLLTDEQATKDNILDGLDWIRKETTSKDVAMVLFAGHGINDQDGRYFYLPYNTDLEKLLRTGVSFEDIKNTVSALAGKTLFFVDTCHSGNVLGTRRGLNTDIVGVINELSSAENGAVVFAASTGNQYSLEDLAWHNGAFTLAVVEGISGRADFDKSGRGRITVNMLDLYISERVKELTKGKQTPTTAKPNTVPDFPVALKK